MTSPPHVLLTVWRSPQRDPREQPLSACCPCQRGWHWRWSEWWQLQHPQPLPPSLWLSRHHCQPAVVVGCESVDKHVSVIKLLHSNDVIVFYSNLHRYMYMYIT